MKFLIYLFGFLLNFSSFACVRHFQRTLQEQTLKTTDAAKNVCVDCTRILEDCIIENVGYEAANVSDINAAYILPENEKGDPSLEKCVVPGIALRGELVNAYCFWSPTLGCQAVKSARSRKGQLLCFDCEPLCECHPATAPVLVGSALNVFLGVFVLRFLFSL